MPFNQYDTIKSVNDTDEDWTIRVRAMSIWKGINRLTGEFKGLNIIFFDDSSERIHAFISAQIASDYMEKLKEGQIYVVEKFNTKIYNGDETNRPIRTDRHIYFSSETKIEPHCGPGLKIPDHSFDLFPLYSLEAMKNDNRFLTDVIGVIYEVEDKAVYKKDDIEKSHVHFIITDGKSFINVTFFNEFGDLFLKEREKSKKHPEIIVISSAKVSEYKGESYLTNFPATRFYFNPNHSSVKALENRHAQPDFYATKVDEEKEAELSTIKINELKKLTETHIEKQVICKLVVKKVEEKMNWYICFCTQCDIQVLLVDSVYKCTECGRVMPYPDKRFQLYTLCSDDTGTIPILWPNDEIVRMTGKEIYEVDVEQNETGDGEKFPQMLKFPLKKTYNFTILVTKENIKEGSNIYKAVQISEEMDLSGQHSPGQNKVVDQLPTEINTTHVVDNQSTFDTPPTGNSSNKTRARLTVDTENAVQPNFKLPKLCEVKKEKV